MTEDVPEKPPTPELPKYLREPLENQSPERLEAVAAYAADLTEWKRRQQQEELDRRRAEDEVDEEELEELDEREISTDPEDYEDVPTNGAYITVKTTKETADKSYRYFYWQWREGDSWKNEYIAPVNPK
jgi:transcription elongation GreA/GreB family factor